MDDRTFFKNSLALLSILRYTTPGVSISLVYGRPKKTSVLAIVRLGIKAEYMEEFEIVVFKLSVAVNGPTKFTRVHNEQHVFKILLKIAEKHVDCFQK